MAPHLMTNLSSFSRKQQKPADLAAGLHISKQLLSIDAHYAPMRGTRNVKNNPVPVLFETGMIFASLKAACHRECCLKKLRAAILLSETWRKRLMLKLVGSTFRPHRRRFITALAALTTIASSISVAQAADKLTMRLDWTAYVMHLPLHLATEKGWFKAADLDVTMEDGNGTINAVQLVGNGKFDLGHGVISAMAVATSKGLPLISVANYMKKSPLGIIYSEKSGINDLKDLAGKTLIYTPASFESPFLEPFLKMHGLPPGSVNLLGVAAAAKITSYASGVGDAFVTIVPSDLSHLEGKRPSKYFLFGDYGMSLPAYGIFANTDSLKTKGPAIKRFVSVVSAAWAYILAGHEQEAINAVFKQRPNAPVIKLDLPGAYKMNRPYMVGKDNVNFPGIQSASDWQQALEVMKTANVIKSSDKPGLFFTNDYIDADYGKKIVAGGK